MQIDDFPNSFQFRQITEGVGKVVVLPTICHPVTIEFNGRLSKVLDSQDFEKLMSPSYVNSEDSTQIKFELNSVCHQDSSNPKKDQLN